MLNHFGALDKHNRNWKSRGVIMVLYHFDFDFFFLFHILALSPFRFQGGCFMNLFFPLYNKTDVGQI